MTYGNYPDFQCVKKVLVVKFRHLGDVLLSTPLFTNLKNYLPDAAIDAVLYKEGKQILEGHPAINKVYFYDRAIKKLPLLKKLKKEYALLKKLKKNSYDLVINLTEGDRGAIITKFCRPKYSVGMKQKKNFLGKNLYTHIVKECPTPRHQVERELDVLRGIGIFPNRDERTLFFHSEAKVDVSFKDTIVFCPFSRWKFKCLSEEKMVKLLEYLISKEHKVLLCGGNDRAEVKIAHALQEKVSSKLVINLVGKLSLKEFGAVIEKSRGVICVDSLALHLSSVYKKNTLVFFGPTSEIKWGPWQNPNARVIVENLSCRPCLLDGCGGSKMADCLFHLDLRKAFKVIDSWSKEKNLLLNTLI